MLLIFSCLSNFGQAADSIQIRRIYDEALTEGEAYENLRQLCKGIGPRLSGSINAAEAVLWGKMKMESYNFDKIWLEEVMVPKWVRGEIESCTIMPSGRELDALTLGFSVGTEGILEAEVVEFQTLESLKNADPDQCRGKIVFLNQAMNPKLIDTFSAYGGCSGARVKGPSIAASKGAVGFVMRSLGMRADDFPHTGVMTNDKAFDSIPAFALSTNSAYILSESLQANPEIILRLQSGAKRYADVLSYNVVGQITGSEYPNKIITVGGHLDSWDVGEGAHDDGAGCIQALEVLRLFTELGIRPRHTIRCVFFMNEENGARGAKKHAELSLTRDEEHLLAMESDRGGFSPRGFSFDARKTQIDYFKNWEELFEPYNIHLFKKGYGGTDIKPLGSFGTPLVGFVPDSQRYFDVHHTANDVFENVNKRELELGTATMTSFIYLIDKYGIPEDLKD